jgi:hypothetical protein
MKNNYKYILLLAVGFLWCSLSYLSQEIVLLNVYDKIITNNVIMIYDSFAMALGIIIFMFLYKKNFDVKKIYIIFLIISICLNIVFYIINPNYISMIISIVLCLIGSAGFGVAYHFSLITSNVKKDNRGLMFAFGYGLGAFLTYLISLIPNDFISSAKLLLILLPLILINIYFININDKFSNIKKNDKLTFLEKKKLFSLIALILVMSLISSFSSNMVAIFNYSKETGFAYSRIYYAIGLLVAGYFADKNNKVFEIASISSLLFPLITIILFKEQINMLMIANLNYFFIAFFVVYRTLSFMNLSDKNKIYLSAFGLCICRVIEGTLSLLNNYFEFTYLFLTICIIILVAFMIGIYTYLYSLNFVNKEDVFQDFCVKYKLSIQEKKILNLILQDYSNQDIASSLVVSINTVRNHVAHIYKKCNMKKEKIKEIINQKTI